MAAPSSAPMAPGALNSLFTERVVLAPGTASWLQVRLRSHNLGDDHMIALGRFMEDLLEKHSMSSTNAVVANVELAENAIGSTGLTAVLDALEKYNVNCKCLKLYKNKIGDDGGTRLARMVTNQATAIEELHLSHNVLTQRSLVAICMAMGKHEGYPQLGRSRLYMPCWLRMEYNLISRPLDVVEALRRDGEVPICTADVRDECGPWRCSRAGRSPAGVPKIHLFTIAVQCRNHRPSNNDEIELREEIRRWGGRTGPAPPTTRIPSGPRSAGPAASPAPSPTGASGGKGFEMGGCSGGGSGGGCSGGRGAGPKGGPAAPNPASRGWGSPTATASGPSAWGLSAAGGLNGGVGPPSGGGAHEDQAAQPPGCRRGFGPSRDAPGGRLAPGVGTGAGGAGAGGGHQGGGYLSATDAAGGDGGVAEAPPPPPPIGGKASARHAEGARCSLLLDVSGKRRIHPDQLEGSDGSTNQFVCPLCSFVMVKPVMTSCCHLFCADCFSSYVGDQVSKQKSKAVASVPVLPCAQPNCTQQLRRQDITSLEKDEKAGASALLQRLRNNLRVRCVHHRDLFDFAFGSDAARVAGTRRATCSWVGDLAGYEDHIRKGCDVEMAIVAAGGAGCEESASTTAALTNGTTVEEHQQLSESTAAEVDDCGAESTLVGDAADAGFAATVTRSSTAIADGGEVRVARYDYVPQETDQAQIPLKANDLVRVYEVTESGWAAGVRLSKRTQEEVGEAGWFPAAYLSPADHVAAEAA
eukprot:TRINITY_DN7575_c0_g1_i1.p1 TRINITY_DN7575_c0_g1~~TRINITY_DN7575_c0_g1_i1.p1  ORF type:complete len:754 (-),score=128.23 TRINITY_DN7575_c0_g1_i1:90-2351(-)